MFWVILYFTPKVLKKFLNLPLMLKVQKALKDLRHEQGGKFFRCKKYKLQLPFDNKVVLECICIIDSHISWMYSCNYDK